MNVKQIIEQLSKYPDDMQVVVCDGYKCNTYQGNWIIQEFEGTVDIGIGGTLIEDGVE